MAVAFVQGAFARTSGATTLAPALTGVTAGNCLVLAITGFRTTSALPSSVSDGVNTYVKVVDLSYAGNTNKALLYIAKNVAAGNVTCTITWATNFLGTAHLSEWSGVDPVTPGDVFSTRTGSASTTPLSNVTPAIEQSGSMAIALLGMTSSPNNPIGIDLPAGYTNLHVEQDGSSYEGFSLDRKAISTAGSTENPNWGTTTSGSWGSIVYILRPPGGKKIRYIGGQSTGFAGGTTTGTINLALTGGAEQLPQVGDLILVTYAVGTQARDPNLTMSGNTSGAYPHVTGSPLLIATDLYDTDLAVFYRIAGATPDVTLTRGATGNAADGGAVVIQVYRGVDGTTPFDVTPTTATGIDTDRPNPPAITPSTANSLIVVAVGGAAATLTTNWTAAYLSNLVQVNGADNIDGRAAMGNVAWTSGAYDPAAFTGGSGAVDNSWAAITMALRPVATGANNEVTTVGLLTSAPTYSSPTIAQNSAAALTSLLTAAPTYSSVTVAQQHSVAQSNLLTAAPIYSSLTVAQVHGVAATGLLTAAPTLTSPTVVEGPPPGTEVTLNGLLTAAPSYSSVAIQQSHAAALASLLTAAPTLATPTVQQRHDLPLAGLLTAAPTYSSVTVQQRQNFALASLLTAAPSLTAPSIQQGHSTSLTGLLTSAPSLTSPTIQQVYVTPLASLLTAAPTLSSPSVVQSSAVAPQSLLTAAPTYSSLTVAQSHAVALTRIQTSAPTLTTTGIAQTHAATLTGLQTTAPSLTGPTVVEGPPAEGASLVSLLTAAPTYSSVTVQQRHAVALAPLLTSAPTLTSPAIAQQSAMAFTSLLTAAPLLSAPQLAQRHDLAVAGLLSPAASVGLLAVTQSSEVAPQGLLTAAPTLTALDVIVATGPLVAVYARVTVEQVVRGLVEVGQVVVASITATAEESATITATQPVTATIEVEELGA